MNLLEIIEEMLASEPDIASLRAQAGQEEDRARRAAELLYSQNSLPKTLDSISGRFATVMRIIRHIGTLKQQGAIHSLRDAMVQPEVAQKIDTASAMTRVKFFTVVSQYAVDRKVKTLTPDQWNELVDILSAEQKTMLGMMATKFSGGYIAPEEPIRENPLHLGITGVLVEEFYKAIAELRT